MRPGAPLLHVLGAGPWQIPTIRRARARGLRVLVTDGLPDRPGFAEADLHAIADLGDAEATTAAARSFGVDGVLCDTTDTGVVAAAMAAEALRLPGPGADAARACCDKAAMTELAAAAGLPVPASATVRTVEEACRAAPGAGPWVVKPVDSQSGKGVTLVDDLAGLESAVREALPHSRAGRVLLQARIPGPEVIVDGLVVRGRPLLLGVAAKQPYADNPSVSSHITYGAVDPAREQELRRALERLIEALGLRQGLVHAEFMLGPEGPVPIDVAARGGGVMIYPLVLPHVSGVDAMDCAIDLALGRGVEPQPLVHRRGAQVRFLRASAGRIRRITGVERARAMPGIAALHLNQGVGDETGTLRHKDDRLGFLVALGDDAASAAAAAEAAAAAIEVETD